MKNALEIILVLYKQNLQNSITFSSVEKYIKHISVEYELIIYNNDLTQKIPLSNKYVVINAKQNDMLAKAYNLALDKAYENCYKWILLLDQDTILNESYFIKLNQFLVSSESSIFNVAVPSIYKGKKHLSPIIYNRFWGPFVSYKPCNSILQINEHHYFAAFNSCSLLNTETLKKIDGFSLKYPLDMLDFYYFYCISKNMESIYLLDVEVEQNLSLLDSQNSMPFFRYK